MYDKIKARRPRRRLAEWLWMLLPGGIGFLIGVLVMLRQGIEMDSNTATLMGSALGAFIAVGLAAWISGTQERRRLEDAKSTITLVFDQYIDAHQRMSKAIKGLLESKGDVALAEVNGAVEALVGADTVMRGRIPALERIFASLGSVGIVAHYDAKSFIEVGEKVAKTFRDSSTIEHWPEDRLRVLAKNLDDIQASYRDFIKTVVDQAK